MTAPYECEVRFVIDDIGAFRAHLAALGAQAIQEYAFTDHYYRPAAGAWNPRERTLRIREHRTPVQPAEVLLTWVDVQRAGGLEFKRSRFPDGKVRLFVGMVDDCRAVVRGLGFEPWLVIPKDAGVMYRIPDLGSLVIEQVAGVGWMCEVEADGLDPEAAAAAIRRRLDALGAPMETAIAEPLAAFVSQRAR